MNQFLTNPVVDVLLAVLIYPGVLVALIVALILGWLREVTEGAFAGTPAVGPGELVGELRDAWRSETILPEGISSAMLSLLTLAAPLFPLLALILLPVPGNPLAASLGYFGDLVAEAALLLGLPVIRLLVGWMIPNAETRAAADRSARLLAGAVLPMGLAVAAMAEQEATLHMAIGQTGHPLPWVSLLARVLATLAFICALPVLARGAGLFESPAEEEAAAADEAAGEPRAVAPMGDAATDVDEAEEPAEEAEGAQGSQERLGPIYLADELAELSGRDAAILRIGEGLQLVAVAAFFVLAFLLPVLTQINNVAWVGVIWALGLLLTAAGIGAWQGWRAKQGTVERETERPPLTWWLGVPVLLALAALVAAAWATRGV